MSHYFIKIPPVSLLGEVSLAPYVVVADEEVHLHAIVGQLRYLAQEAGVALGYDVVVLEPKVEDVAQHVHCRGFVLDAVEELDQSSLSRTHRGECSAA